jgi:uroporphyrinogen decarboxylase
MMGQTADFAGLRVAAFESRRAEEMARLIERFGGVASVSPSMREVSLDDRREAIDFAHRVMGGEIDIVILMTGVGVRHLLAAVERQVDLQRFLDALSDATTIVRGPKPLVVLRELGVTPKHLVPEPNTWRELLQTIDQHVNVANQTVGLQEYGLPNPSLIAGLEARGAHVQRVRVYQWELPEDTAPLEANVRAIADGQRDVAMFTSSQQVLNLLQMAANVGQERALREQLQQMVVASIGPTTSETLAEQGIPADLEPEHPKMGHLVSDAARRAGELLERKRRLANTRVDLVRDPNAAPDPAQESLFLKACRREPTERVPIWLMRQAGRYMPEYREVRAKQSFLELCKNPQLCAEVMITAVERLGVDAAIIFADLLPILEPMGFELEFAAGEGPVIHNPVRESSDLFRVQELETVDALHFVIETVKATRAGLPTGIPVIGFAGAPFTLASYAIEGGSSRHYLHTKTLMYRDEGAWNELMGRLVRAVSRLLLGQIAAGAHAVQIFDSWVGCLHPDDYRRYVLPHTRAVIESLPRDVPVIHFGTGNPQLLPLYAEAGGDVIGIDWRIRLDQAWPMVGYDRAIQGNLDPTVLLSDPSEIRRRAHEVLGQAKGRPGHIFNLGHGVLPQTPVDHVLALIDAVREWSPK